MKYELELYFKTQNDQHIKKENVKQRIAEKITGFHFLRIAALPMDGWRAEIESESWSGAVFDVLTMLKGDKRTSIKIDAISRGALRAIGENPSLVGAENISVVLYNSAADDFRYDDYSVMAAVRHNDAFRKIYKTLFENDLVLKQSDDYYDWDLLINPIFEFNTYETEKRAAEGLHKFTNNFEIADALCEYCSEAEEDFISFCKTCLENPEKGKERWDLSDWAYLIKLMCVYRLRDHE